MSFHKNNTHTTPFWSHFSIACFGWKWVRGETWYLIRISNQIMTNKPIESEKITNQECIKIGKNIFFNFATFFFAHVKAHRQVLHCPCTSFILICHSDGNAPFRCHDMREACLGKVFRGFTHRLHKYFCLRGEEALERVIQLRSIFLLDCVHIPHALLPQFTLNVAGLG